MSTRSSDTDTYAAVLHAAQQGDNGILLIKNDEMSVNRKSCLKFAVVFSRHAQLAAELVLPHFDSGG